MADGVNSKNAAAVAGQYTDDSAILLSGTGQIDGKETIQSYWKAGIDA